MQAKGAIPFFFLLLCFSSGVVASEARVLLDVHRVELNNKGKPMRRSYSNWSSYTLFNLDSGEQKLVHKASTAKGSQLQLSYGIWCMRSIALTASQYLSLVNPLCFEVDRAEIINAGTWVVGWRFSDHEAFAGIIEAKENFDELAARFEVGGYLVPQFFALDPKRLDEAMEQLRQSE